MMEYLELKPGWVIRVPHGMTMMELARYRFDPITIALVTAAAVGTVSAVQQGRAARAQGDFQEKIAFRNAEEARKAAEGQREAAAEAAIEQERRGKALKGRQRALFAKSGVELRGSPLAVLVETAQDLEADRLEILRQGAIGASSLEAQAGIIQAQGTAAKARGRATQRASVLSAIGTGASGLATAGLARSRLSTGRTSSLQSRVPGTSGGFVPRG